MIGFAERSSDVRLLTFEVERQVYALPIDGVLEVAEAGAICGVPTLERKHSAVMNWHGDALPLVSPRRLLLTDEEANEEPVLPDPEHSPTRSPLARDQVLVLSERGGEAPCLGLPIDGVLGIVVGSSRSSRPSNDVVIERRPVDGRVVSVLDPHRLVMRAKEVIEQMA